MKVIFLIAAILTNSLCYGQAVIGKKPTATVPVRQAPKLKPQVITVIKENDKDGDGIINERDKCPDDYGELKFEGCPDSDGDGLIDKDDKCPHERGEIGNNGCPVSYKEYVYSKTLIGHTGIVKTVVFGNGGILISGSADNTLRIWDLNKAQPVNTIKEHKDEIESIGINETGSSFFSASRDGTIKIWDIKSANCTQSFTADFSVESPVTYNFNSNRLLKFMQDAVIKVVEGERFNVGIEGVQFTSIYSTRFSTDGSMIAVSCAFNDIRIYGAASGTLSKTLKGHEDNVISLCFSSDGTKLLSGGLDQTVKLWDVYSGKLLKTFSGHSGAVSAVCFSVDGSQIASASFDGSVRIWDITSGKVLQNISETNKTIQSLCFNNDGTKLAFGCVENIKIWEVRQ